MKVDHLGKRNFRVGEVGIVEEFGENASFFDDWVAVLCYIEMSNNCKNFCDERVFHRYRSQEVFEILER